jgi:1,4-dihydroxy-2-naphthoyl-CoA synthase
MRGLFPQATPHPSECDADACDALSHNGRGRRDYHRDPTSRWGKHVTKPLLIEHDDGVDRVTLNRPDSLNALSSDLIDALNGYFESLQRNRTTRVVVLRGAGQAFCAGLDLKQAMARRAGQQEPPGVTESLDSQRRIADIVLLMRRCPQPIVALVQGAAAGGGFALALAAAIRCCAAARKISTKASGPLWRSESRSISGDNKNGLQRTEGVGDEP